jgi:hypothetical protein
MKLLYIQCFCLINDKNITLIIVHKDFQVPFCRSRFELLSKFLKMQVSFEVYFL